MVEQLLKVTLYLSTFLPFSVMMFQSNVFEDIYFFPLLTFLYFYRSQSSLVFGLDLYELTFIFSRVTLYVLVFLGIFFRHLLFYVMRLYVKKPMFPLLSGVPFSKAI